LKPATGEVDWETQLCLQPDGRRSVWSPAGVAVEGSTAYVATGAGVVAAVDTRWGNIQWLATYPRGTKQNGQTAHDGCGEDVVIPHGSLVVVMASDCTEVFALDRRTGALRWSTSRAITRSAAAVDYCLGVVDDHLYLAGNRLVRCHQISGGRAIWEYPLDDSLGRGALTSETIYMPSGDSIVCLDPSPQPISADQRRQGELHLSDSFGEPIGNLVSDGQQLLGVGMSRVYRLGIDEAMAMLDEGGN
jgi:outer membrane protein assembly factor BamB